MKSKMTNKQKNRTVLVGVAASPGYAYGPVRKIETRKYSLDSSALPTSALAEEENHFLSAVDKAAKEIQNLKKVTGERLGEEEARIFDSHLMMLRDSTVLDPIIQSIRQKRHNARWAVHSTLSALIAKFESSKMEIMRERTMDLREIYNRLLAALDEATSAPLPQSKTPLEPSNIVSHELTPGMLMSIEKNEVLGFATDIGGRTKAIFPFLPEPCSSLRFPVCATFPLSLKITICCLLMEPEEWSSLIQTKKT